MDALPQTPGFSGGQDALQPHTDLLVRGLQLDLDGKILGGGFAAEFFPETEAGPALARESVSRASQRGMRERGELARSPGQGRRRDRHSRLESWPERGASQFGVEPPLQLRNPMARLGGGTEKPAPQKHRG